MENNSNAIAEIQKKYAGCNLLMPAATEVQLNPFYKITVMEVTADLSENSGDIFKVGSVKTGTTQQGKPCLCMYRCFPQWQPNMREPVKTRRK